MHVEAEGVPLERSAVDIGNPAHTISYNAGGIIQRTGLGESAARVKIISQQSDNRLADGEASAGQNYKHSLSRLNEAIHLATHVDLIKSCIGPRIRSQHQTFLR